MLGAQIVFDILLLSSNVVLCFKKLKTEFERIIRKSRSLLLVIVIYK